MPSVIFESHKKPPLQVSAPAGGSLADLCDEVNAPIPFSCRSASCGTCRMEVLEGGDLLTEPEDEELDVLDIFDSAPPRFRLACCARMKVTDGLVRVRSVSEEE